jgi:hypothetical protein
MTERQHRRLFARAARRWPRCPLFADALRESRRCVKRRLPLLLALSGERLAQTIYDALELKHE